LGAGLSENGVVRRDGKIAYQVQDVASADGIPGDDGDDRLGQRPDLPLQVEHVETGDVVVAADVTAVSPDLLVPSGAKSLVARPGQQYDADLLVVSRLGKGVHEFLYRFRAKSVSYFGPVDRDLGDAVVLFV